MPGSCGVLNELTIRKGKLQRARKKLITVATVINAIVILSRPIMQNDASQKEESRDFYNFKALYVKVRFHCLLNLWRARK